MRIKREPLQENQIYTEARSQKDIKIIHINRDMDYICLENVETTERAATQISRFEMCLSEGLYVLKRDLF